MKLTPLSVSQCICFEMYFNYALEKVTLQCGLQKTSFLRVVQPTLEERSGAERLA